MNKLNHYTYIILACYLMLYSCKTTETFTVQALPGTKIYSPENIETPKGEVPQSGKVKIKLSLKKEYYGYLIAEMPQSKIRAPFGLDYKRLNTLNTIGGVWGIIFGPSAIAGGILSISEDTGLGAAALGAGVALTALGIHCMQNEPTDGICSDLDFIYLKNQTAIQDIPFSSTTSVIDPARPSSVEPTEKVLRKKTTSGNTVAEPKTTTTTPTKAKRRLNDFGASIAGEYSGTGELLKGKAAIETYNDIRIVIMREDKDLVKVQ